MSKKLIISLVIGLLVIGGGVAVYIAFSDNGAGSSSNESSNGTALESNGGRQFSPVPTTGLAFVATMNGTTSKGQSYSATIESDGKGSAHYKGETGSSPVEFYSTKDAYIFCSSGSCFKYGSGGTSTANQTPGQYSYSEKDFETFKQIANYTGRESCPAGMCDAWEISQQNGYKTKVLISDGNRVSQLHTEGPDGNFTITYEYKDVTIKLPSNVKTLPSP